MPKILENFQLGFAACRIGIRKCWQWMLCHSVPFTVKEQYEVLCLGLLSAGKSTILANLVGESTNEIEPTTGFNIKTLPIKDTILNIKELGGSDHIRPFWNRYFAGQHGIIFVVDASKDNIHLQEVNKELQTILNDQSLKSLPCIILGTHQDLENAKTAQELQEIFSSALQGCPWKIFVCGINSRESICEGVEELVDMMNNSI